MLQVSVIWQVWCRPPVPLMIGQSFNFWVHTTLHFLNNLLKGDQIYPLQPLLQNQQSHVSHTVPHKPPNLSHLLLTILHRLFLSLIASMAHSLFMLSAHLIPSIFLWHHILNASNVHPSVFLWPRFHIHTITSIILSLLLVQYLIQAHFW